MNLRTLKSRLKRLEKLSGAGSYDVLLKNLPDDQLSAYVDALGAVWEIDDEEEGAIVAAEIIAEQLGWSEDRAMGFYFSCRHMGNAHFGLMTDEQLRDWIEATEAELGPIGV